MSDQSFSDKTVAVVGLGYVGLPLALAFGKKVSTIGFDLDEAKIGSYLVGRDPSGEMDSEKFKAAGNIQFTSEGKLLEQADFIIVAVPTPIDQARQPELSPIKGASDVVGRHMKSGAVIVYESTVYPGVTEEIAVPILEKVSGMSCGQDFFVGYSPERINPGDKEHTLEKIIKIVSGQDQNTLDEVASLYELVIEAGVHRASSIKVAEAAKVIENTQRDLNIALMNELAIIFDRLNIDTAQVLEAANTKWNFLPFKPGLVGGHCIGVDPYYLTHKAQQVGYHPEVILAGRRINDNMGKYIAEKTIKRMIKRGCVVKGAPVLVMGLTFKENCADLRNSKVIEVIRELESYQVKVLVWDPVADSSEAMEQYGVELVNYDSVNEIQAIVAAVPHREILAVDLHDLMAKSHSGAPFIDVKSAFNENELEDAGFSFWRL